jgi:hypothetical protein
MALIGNFPATASAVFNLDFLPEFILVGETFDANFQLSSLSVVTSGIQLMSITANDRITALAKYDGGALLAAPGAGPSEVAMYLKLATGRINKATTITGTNAAAGIQPIYAASTNISSVARRAVEQSINPSANATFDNFECLIFSLTNVLRAQITWANGYSDEFTVAELRALYGAFHIAEAAGTLNGLLCIDSDSGAGLIAQVVLYNSAGGSTVVLKTDYVQV